MYEFSRSTLVWIAFAVFLLGSLYRVIVTLRLARKDKVVLPYMKWRFGLRSLLHWTVPYAATNMRMQPAITLLSFLFHACLLSVPLLTLGHVTLFKDAWGFGWWTLPDALSKVMTVIVLIGAAAFFLRRIASPAVRFVSSASDFALLVLVAAPFVTGLMARYQVFDHETVVIVHAWTGAVWLAMIPFTRIAHMLYFPLTRAYMGCEFGYVRNARDW
jgi:nitrate reductase gamma subunit